MADGGDPDRIEMAADTPDRLRDMVRTVHFAPAQPRAAAAVARGGCARRAAGEHERLEAAARAAPELALAPGSATVARAVERLEGCRGPLDATPAGAAPRPPGSTT